MDDRIKTGRKISIIGIIANVFLGAAKFLVGTISGSISITADAVNNLTDAASSIITLISFYFSNKKPDDKHPYGYARIEYLSGLIIVALILVLGFELVKSSIESIIHPEPVDFSFALIIVLAISIIVKLGLSAYTIREGKKINAKALIASGEDAKMDVISTSAVLVSSVVGKVFGINIDGYIGLAVALFIIWNGIQLGLETISPLLGEAPDEELVKQLESLILSHDRVLGIHDMIIHDYGPGKRYASAHAEMDYRSDVLISHEILDDIESEARSLLNVELTMHYDPIVTDDPEIEFGKEICLCALKDFDERIKIHDFRMVKGEGHSNFIFDVVIPRNLRGHEFEIKAAVADALREKSDKKLYFPVLTFDDEVFNN